MIDVELRKAVIDSGVTGYRLAIETGIPQSTISRFINEEADLSLTKAAKIADFLQLELRQIPKTRRTKG